MRVLCFGDSNTWGYNAEDGSRFPETVRWTGRLAAQLGDGFEVIEEGLNGRTTIFDYVDKVGKNGRDALRPALDAHAPLDVVILYLGTNDTKAEFGKSAEEIAAGLEELIRIARAPGRRIIVVAPTLIDERYLAGGERVGAEAKTRALPALYRALAAKHGCEFIDLSAVAPSPVDGCHLDPDAHARIAAIFAAKITGAGAGTPSSDPRARSASGTSA